MEISDDQAHDVGRLCDGCGKPPRRSTDDKLESYQQLMRCSRCRKAFYHDRICQKLHYRDHKKYCNSTVNFRKGGLRENISAKEKQQQRRPFGSSNPSYSCELKEGRGRCMVSTCKMAVGRRIAPTLSAAPGTSGSPFAPFVLPVLTRSNRSIRCACCFGSLSEVSHRGDLRPLINLYCSIQCHERAANELEAEETAAWMLSKTLTKLNGKALTPTALLLYRIIRRMAIYKSSDEASLVGLSRETSPDEYARHTLGSLQSNSKLHSPTEQQYLLHIAEVSRLLVVNSSWWSKLQTAEVFAEKILNPGMLLELGSKILTNSFTICNGEGSALGLGLYPDAAIINHCCRPNLAQTFAYGHRGIPPGLFVTTCRDVVQGEELCIGYIDISAPSDVRKSELKDNYKFECNCDRCLNKEMDDGTVCPRKGCSGFGRALPNEPHTLVCESCGQDDFSQNVEKRNKAFFIVEKLRKRGRCAEENNLFPMLSVKSSLYPRTKEMLAKLESAYHTLKQTCRLSSWYVQEAGEELVQSMLDSLNEALSEEVKKRICFRALSVLEELSREKVDTKSEVSISWLIRRFKAAKLKLFLYPDPRSASEELQNVYRQLLLFHTKDSELIKGIEECMVSALS